MYRNLRSLAFAAALLAALACAPWLFADTYDLSWHTIDGGGAMLSSGGNFEVSGTIGQHDARSHAAAMTGGSFELVGGFWVAGAIGVCTCPGDLNGDALVNGDDIQLFIDCLLSSGSGCACADIDGVGGVTFADVALFMNALLNSTGCP